MPTSNLITPTASLANTEMAMLRELDERTGDGVTVRLLWDQSAHLAIVEVEGLDSGERFTLICGTEDNPLDVFHHPYFYAALRTPNAA